MDRTLSERHIAEYVALNTRDTCLNRYVSVRDVYRDRDIFRDRDSVRHILTDDLCLWRRGISLSETYSETETYSEIETLWESLCLTYSVRQRPSQRQRHCQTRIQRQRLCQICMYIYKYARIYIYTQYIHTLSRRNLLRPFFIDAKANPWRSVNVLYMYIDVHTYIYPYIYIYTYTHIHRLDSKECAAKSKERVAESKYLTKSECTVYM